MVVRTRALIAASFVFSCVVADGAPQDLLGHYYRKTSCGVAARNLKERGLVSAVPPSRLQELEHILAV